jgi:uncharacterized ferredoxin-like protein
MNIDNRMMYSIGVAAKEMKLLIPLSHRYSIVVTGKSPARQTLN